MTLETNVQPWSEAVARFAAASRILVLGPSGAGKSHFARQLAPLVGLPLYHLDALFWRPGWRSFMPRDEWDPLVERLTREPRWIIDGTYERTLAARVKAADCLVIVERPRAVCLLRAFQRALFLRRTPRPDAPVGERFTPAFARYIWRYPRDTRPIIERVLAEHGTGKTVVVLGSEADNHRLLIGLGSR